MRKIYFLLLFVCSFLANFNLAAQTTLTIPAANTNDGSLRQPLGTYWGFEKSALIFRPSEFNGVFGQITAIAFYVDALATPGQMTNVRVYMKKATRCFYNRNNLSRGENRCDAGFWSH
ncbi:MAG: hypothetical protein NVV59_19045 [Chitinophagaceae bacterium]|nr:hypothetical protein [Chitinophagaceae bacterium]